MASLPFSHTVTAIAATIAQLVVSSPGLRGAGAGKGHLHHATSWGSGCFGLPFCGLQQEHAKLQVTADLRTPGWREMDTLSLRQAGGSAERFRIFV